MSSPNDSTNFLTTIGSGATRLTLEELKEKTAWIRNELEPIVAKYGPDSLQTDHALEVQLFLQRLLAARISQNGGLPDSFSITESVLRVSRIHLALQLLTGIATRWPGKIIALCEAVRDKWTCTFGDLNLIRPLLYEPDGRLAGIAENAALSRSAMLIKWLSDPNSMVTPLRALEFGHLGFQPGQWWIHPIFAFHDGIISSPDPSGGITGDNNGAYAILVTDYDEVWLQTTPEATRETFRYRCKRDDGTKLKLTGAILLPKNSIRVLRSHTLRGFTKPAVGVRYEGLYRVIAFGTHLVDEDIVWEVTLQREADQVSMTEVCKRPTAEEEEDYREYIKLRNDGMRQTGSRNQSTIFPPGYQLSPGTLIGSDNSDIHIFPETDVHLDTILSSRHRPVLAKSPDQPSDLTSADEDLQSLQLEIASSRLLEFQQEQYDQSRQSEEEREAGNDDSLEKRISALDGSAISPQNPSLPTEHRSVTEYRPSVVSRRRSIDVPLAITRDLSNESLSTSSQRFGSDSGITDDNANLRRESSFWLSDHRLSYQNLMHLAKNVNLLLTSMSMKTVGQSYLDDLEGMKDQVDVWIAQDITFNGDAVIALQSLQLDLSNVFERVKPINEDPEIENMTVLDQSTSETLGPRDAIVEDGSIGRCFERRGGISSIL